MPSTERKKLRVPAVLAVVTIAAASLVTACGDKPKECPGGGGSGGSAGSGGIETAENCGGEGGSVA